MDVYLQRIGALRPPKDAGVGIASDELREDSDDVDAHPGIVVDRQLATSRPDGDRRGLLAAWRWLVAVAVEVE